MRPPTLTEFLDLFALPTTNGFPDDLQRNHSLFASWLTRATGGERDALWGLLNRCMLSGLSAYFTATVSDDGFRVGRRAVQAPDADTVVAIFRFPEGNEPLLDINPRTILKSRIPAQVRKNLFGASRHILSPAAQTFAAELDGLLRGQGRIIGDLLNDAPPYVHSAWRSRMAHRLPCSHPVGGLSPNSAEAKWRDDWKSASR